MAKADIDWGNLGFGYRALPERYVANYAGGTWDAGGLTSEATVTISECAGILHYCQEVFEGLKAYETVNGDIVTFRPDLNAERMYHSAAYLEMPSFPQERFLEAVDAVVAANRDYVPPYGSGASLYLRPLIFATGEVIGVKPADAYQFRLFATPVGPYFKGGAKPVRLCVSDFDRAAPHGTGHIKAGLNYAMSLHAYMAAHEAGFDENMFLDAATRTYVEETGGANFLFVTKDGTIVTPKSDSILPSITRRSLVYIAEHILGMKVEERPVAFAELADFAEGGLCGTAAVISPIGSVTRGDKVIALPSGRNCTTRCAAFSSERWRHQRGGSARFADTISFSLRWDSGTSGILSSGNEIFFCEADRSQGFSLLREKF